MIRYNYVGATRGDRPDYHALAEFRYQIRRFLRFSETAARACGLEPAQHQLLLMVKGMPESLRPTIGQIAERMLIEHHSAVELVSRLSKLGAVTRTRSRDDGREVLVRLTPRGEELLRKLTACHQSELETAGPQLIDALERAIRNSARGERKRGTGAIAFREGSGLPEKP